MHTVVMPMTLDQIVEETRQMPEDTVAELVDRIMLAKHGADDAPPSPAWREEIRRRVADIRSGREPGVDGEEVMARARQIVGR
jgi:putative addiction module component (TIGR02574 family)